MKAALGLALILPLLASCSGAKVQNERRLILSLNPAELKPGVLVQLTAVPEPKAEMAWVSGTVKVMGAPVMPFKKDADGNWSFRTMIPLFATLEPGKYEARAWGDSKEGKRYEGDLSIDVK